jgi:poly(3-hydroxybutyrate) depolymerase
VGQISPLPSLSIDPHGITVSGISAGGYMATQFHVAHSGSVSGSAAIASGPWYCAHGDVMRALGPCLSGPADAIDVPALVAAARSAAESRSIDPLAGLADDPVWIFRGTQDPVVGIDVARALADFHGAVAPAAPVTLTDSIAAGHACPIAARGDNCADSAAPYLGECGYDAAGVLLSALYGDLDEPDGNAEAAGELVRFRQTPYRDAEHSAGLADEGFVFIPHECAGAPRACRLHIAFHGCRQSAATVGDAFANRAGYNRWAARNHIVVLYPQIRPTVSPLNPNACWDWWGYEGPAYATRDAPQIRAIRRMVAALAGPATGSAAESTDPARGGR